MAEYAYKQNDNEIVVEFLKDGAPPDLSAATKISLQLFASNSDPVSGIAPVMTWYTVSNAALFDTSQLGIGKLTFKPDSSALSSLSGKYFGRLVVFSTDHPNGIVWTKGLNDLFDFYVGI